MRRFFYNAQLLGSNLKELGSGQLSPNLNTVSNKTLNSAQNTTRNKTDFSDNLQSENTPHNRPNNPPDNTPNSLPDYIPVALHQLDPGTLVTLPEEVYHHWCRVLRAKTGDQSVMFDGLGGCSVVELETVDKKSASVRILSHLDDDNVPLYFSTIAIVMSRGDRMDFAIQKATELGATAIQLLTSQYGEVKLKANQIDKKLNHWQQVALSACEQCELNRPPLILSPLPIESWLQHQFGEMHDSVLYLTLSPFYHAYFNQPPLPLVLAVPNQDEHAVLDVDQSIREQFAYLNNYDYKPRFDILIGAEGGLSKDEYKLARSSGYLPWQLGTRVLRTETAPVVALSTLLYISSEYRL